MAYLTLSTPGMVIAILTCQTFLAKYENGRTSVATGHNILCMCISKKSILVLYLNLITCGIINERLSITNFLLTGWGEVDNTLYMYYVLYYVLLQNEFDKNVGTNQTINY